jgi:polyisoprenoid-binding protein YceI
MLAAVCTEKDSKRESIRYNEHLYNRRIHPMSSVATPEVTAVSTWNIDPAHSHAEFKVRHMMISNVKGEFKGIKGTLKLNDADLTQSGVEVSIDAATIDTGEAQRDGHLKTADFLDVEKFPTLAFKSTGVVKGKKGELKVSGDLTIHGVTRNVEFEVEGSSAPVKDPWGNTRIGLSATTRINRKDFGLTWNAALETGGILVGEEINITLDVQFIKA